VVTLTSFSVILRLVEQLPKVVAAAPEFKKLFDAFVATFRPHEQTQLKDAYQRAIAESDAAQEDFVKASRGE
jgi:hypothetical protein